MCYHPIYCIQLNYVKKNKVKYKFKFLLNALKQKGNFVQQNHPLRYILSTVTNITVIYPLSISISVIVITVIIIMFTVFIIIVITFATITIINLLSLPSSL